MGAGLPALAERAVEAALPTPFPTYREVVMSMSKRRSGDASVPEETVQAGQAPAGDNGRDARGRFAPGNAGGPGNPFARRVAELRTWVQGPRGRTVTGGAEVLFPA